MKPLRHLLILFLFFIPPVQAKPIWTIGTAEIMPQGKYESGVFSPLRYGWKEDIELSTYAIFDVILPNISLKKQWLKNKNAAFSSEHSLSYPSLFLDIFSKEGIAGILPANTSVPTLLTINNQLIYTLKLSPSLWISPQFAIETTLNAKKGAMPTIDFPLAYQSTASWHTGTSYRLGVDIDGAIAENWSYTLDLDLYDLGGLKGNQAMEHKAILRYQLKSKNTILFGYKYVSGDYPFGKDARFFPFADYLWQW